MLYVFLLWTAVVKFRKRTKTRCAPGDARRNALVVRLVQLFGCAKRSMLGTTDLKWVL